MRSIQTTTLILIVLLLLGSCLLPWGSIHGRMRLQFNERYGMNCPERDMSFTRTKGDTSSPGRNAWYEVEGCGEKASFLCKRGFWDTGCNIQ